MTFLKIRSVQKHFGVRLGKLGFYMIWWKSFKILIFVPLIKNTIVSTFRTFSMPIFLLEDIFLNVAGFLNHLIKKILKLSKKTAYMVPAVHIVK